MKRRLRERFKRDSSKIREILNNEMERRLSLRQEIVERGSTKNEHLFHKAWRTIGLWPVRPLHILNLDEGEYSLTVDDIKDMETERALCLI